MKRATAQRKQTPRSVPFRPSDVLHIQGDGPLTQADAAAIRRALVVAVDSPIMHAALMRDCHIRPYWSRVARPRFLVQAAKIRRSAQNGRVAAIVPNYNYGRFVLDALQSLMRQTRPPDEIIIVDDASTDDSIARINLAMMDWGREFNIRLIQHPTNRGNVGAARNTGIAATDAQYVVCLDSDDLLEPAYIETCRAALEADQGAGVVYTGVQTLEQTGGNNYRKVWKDWPIPFDWDWMAQNKIPFNTCIPTASMFRREFWERAGGYDEGIASAEDLEFWTRALACGWDAVKCTAEPLFVYRRHGPSMTSERRQTNVAVWNPVYQGAKPLAAPTGAAPVLRDYTRPVVSVVIPCGPKHAATLPTAIASVLAQTIDRWEIIVINDTGRPLPLTPWPFVREYPGIMTGPAAARNIGVEIARAPLVFFLDADDYIMPTALEKMIRRYAQGDAGYVYSGWRWLYADGKSKSSRPPAYDRRGMLDTGPAAGRHAVSVLMARADVQRIGGFDADDVPRGFEDREFFARCAVAGLCGVPIQDELLVYRWDAGTMRNAARADQDKCDAVMMRRYGPVIRGEKIMGGCCGGNGDAVRDANAILAEGNARAFNLANGPADSETKMRYTGPREGDVPYFNKYSGYKGMAPIPVDPADVSRLQETGVWEIVPNVPHTPTPAAIYPDPTPTEHAIQIGNGETLRRTTTAPGDDLGQSTETAQSGPQTPPEDVQALQTQTAAPGATGTRKRGRGA